MVGGQYLYGNGQTSKRLKESSGPGNYKKALTKIKKDIFQELYPEDKLTENNQNSIPE
jgi:hypothetical protein